MPIHPTATVDPSAKVHESTEVGPYCYVGPNCVLGENNVLMRGAWLGPNTHVGRENVFHPQSLVGEDPQYLGFNPATTSGTIIGNGNHFRELSTVHRGLKDGSNTIFGNNNFLMTTAHVAHDCVIGNNVVIVNYSGLSGHVTVEDGAFISGYVGVHQFCRIGTMAMIGGRAGLSKDAPPYMTVKYYPGVVIGLNVVGLRRAGVNAETRAALKHCYREMFRRGRPLAKSVEMLHAEWNGREMPREVAHLLDFCAMRSRRGMSTGPRATLAGDESIGSEGMATDGS